MKYAEVEAIVKQAIDKHQENLNHDPHCGGEVSGTDLGVEFISDILYEYVFDKAIALEVWKKLEGIND